LYISDKSSKISKAASPLGAYLAASVFCALFGAVYELFSHGVFSYWMIYAFFFPLLLGAIPSFLLQRRGAAFPGRAAADCIHGGIAWLTVGSIVQGVLEIYGTTNPLVKAFWLTGAGLFLIGWLQALTAKADRT